MQLLLTFNLAGLAVAQLEPIAPVTPPKGTQPTNLPAMGMGTWRATGTNVTNAVAQAIVDGYRLIDTAPIYGNQKEVGHGIKEGIKRAGIRREDVWITSKLWNSLHDNPMKGLNDTLKEMGLDYVDLYLIHWPMGPQGGFDHVATWKRMEQLPATKLTRYIGVSNFSPKQVEEVLKIAKIKPKVLQIETHPYLPQQEYVTYAQKQGITVNAYAPLANTNPVYTSPAVGKIFQHSTIREISTQRGCTPAQVVIAWHMRRNVVPIPKAVVGAHQKENYAAQECKGKMTAQDDAKIQDITKVRAYRFFSIPCALQGYRCFEGTTGGF